MMPPSNNPSLHLQILPGPFFVAQFQYDRDIPPWVLQGVMEPGRFFSLTRTNDELSLVGELQDWMPDDLKQLSTWTCIKIVGPMEHSLVGIMADLTAPLKAAKVPIFTISTWNTDYILVATVRLNEARTALKNASWVFLEDEPESV